MKLLLQLNVILRNRVEVVQGCEVALRFIPRSPLVLILPTGHLRWAPLALGLLKILTLNLLLLVIVSNLGLSNTIKWGSGIRIVSEENILWCLATWTLKLRLLLVYSSSIKAVLSVPLESGPCRLNLKHSLSWYYRISLRLLISLGFFSLNIGELLESWGFMASSTCFASTFQVILSIRIIWPSKVTALLQPSLRQFETLLIGQH